MSHLLALAMALMLDFWLGDTRWLPHPVRGMGQLITFFDRRLNKGTYRRLKGIVAVMAVT